MKKITATAIALFVYGSTALFAQHITYGIKGGANITGGVNYSQAANGSLAEMGFPATDLHFKSRLLFAYHAGVYGNVTLSKKLSLQPEVLYSNQQYKLRAPYNVYGMSGTAELYFKLQYINIPVMVQYHTSPRFYIEAGPQAGILLSIKGTGSATQFGSETKDLKSSSRTIDLSLAAGAGYHLPKLPVGFYARVTGGLNPVIKNNNGSYRNYQGQLGVYLQLRK